MSEKRFLFSYGTLQQKEIQKILLGTEVKMKAATLPSWRLYQDADQYYFIKPEEGCEVSGSILELTQEQFWMIDQWEEIPGYTRRKATVQSNQQQIQDVHIYVRPESTGKPVVNPGFSGHSEAADVATARMFREKLDTSDLLPFVDFYIMIPGLLDTDSSQSAVRDSFSDEFLAHYPAEKSAKRSSLGMIELFHPDPYLSQVCPAFISQYTNTGKSIVTIAIPAAVLSPFALDKLHVSKNKETPFSSIEEWLEFYSFKMTGRITSAIFSQVKLNHQEFQRLCERERRQELGSSLKKKMDGYSPLICTDSTLIFQASEFQENYHDRLQLHVPILHMIEGFLLHEKNRSLEE